MVLKSLVRYEEMDKLPEREPEPIRRSDKSNLKYPHKSTSIKVESLFLIRAIAISAIALASISALGYFGWVAITTFVGGSL